MKNAVFIFCCLFFTTSTFAQSLKYLHKKSVPCDIVTYEKIKNSAKDGVLVFSTAVRNLKFQPILFEISEIDSTSINGYILIVEYNSDWANRKFHITISGNEYQELRFLTSVSGEQCYKLKSSSRKPFDWKEDFKIIVGLSNGIVAGEILGFYGELKFGERTGFALEGGYGFGIGKYDSERWSVGVKGYYRYWFLSIYYGTTMSVANKNTSFSMNDDGTFILEGSRTAHRKGITLLGGYDRTLGWLHLTAGVGATVTTTINPKFLFAWNVGVGFSFMDFFNR